MRSLRRTDLWTIFQGRVLRPAFEGQPATEYEELVRQLGLAAPLEACHLLTTAKRMFARNLRSVAAEYAGPDGDAEAEVADLRHAFQRRRNPDGPCVVISSHDYPGHPM